MKDGIITLRKKIVNNTGRNRINNRYVEYFGGRAKNGCYRTSGTANATSLLLIDRAVAISPTTK